MKFLEFSLVLAFFGAVFAQDLPMPDCVPITERPPPIGLEDMTSSGPERGSLLIAGGALTNRGVYDRFLELAGGDFARIVYVPTNTGNRYETPEERQRELENFEALTGWTNVTLVHTNDRDEANTQAFVAPIQQSTGVYFSGGRPTHSVDSYLGTLAQVAFQQVIERGWVIGGSSAGASLQGDPLIRGDTPSNRPVLGDHREGFAYVKNVGIDQHFLPRNRHNDLLEAISAYPDMLGIAIDEQTAIVVIGDEFEVIGESYVAMYDKTLWTETIYCGDFPFQGGPGRPVLSNGGKYFFLKPGDRYDIRTREITNFAKRLDDEWDL